MIFKNVETLARKNNIPIYELEKRAGIANGTVGRWKSSSPNIRSLQAVAKVLGVKVDELLE
ncbi:MAG: helix-turn-helix transcriptional regulator [Lachnospiraceae bacterium]